MDLSSVASQLRTGGKVQHASLLHKVFDLEWTDGIRRRSQDSDDFSKLFNISKWRQL